MRIRSDLGLFHVCLAPRSTPIGLLPELCIAFHLHYISFALHLKNLPRQHEMHATS